MVDATMDATNNTEVETLRRACPDIEAVQLDDGDYLVREGEDGTDIFLVTRGAYAVEQASGTGAPGEAAPLAAVMVDPEQPSFVGEMAYLGSCRRTASVRCSGRTHVLRLKPAHLDFVMARCPGLTRSLCRQFADRLRAVNESLRAFHELTAMQKEMVMKQPGEPVTRQGEPADRLFQLVDGSLREEASGRILTPDMLPEGFIEPLAYFRQGAWTATRLADSPCILVAIGPSSRLAVIRNYPQLLLDT
jgi:CRP-like cAMP-binding protein